MLSKVLSGATYGIKAYIVEVETHLEKMIPGFAIVGLPDSAVRESRSALRPQCGIAGLNSRPGR